ncbi:hypothetical protein [Nocardioides pelophilus]|uniref:hypothetical protein n=1 Tax=Nocardioides pelophilus TaxID=2172019 RepID=UPI001600E21A|nr:hypothetical protein [Nocardioides pelophilus]
MTTDEPAEQLDPVSPEDEAKIRALLAGARATGPLPAAVAARLDETVVGLAAERATAEPVAADATVVPIVRTRRHRVVAVLGAAAAVAVFGLAVGTFFDGGQDDGAAGDSANSGAVDRGDVALEDADEGEFEQAGPTDDDGTLSRTEGSVEPNDIIGEFTVRSRHLVRDLSLLQEAVLPDPNAADYDLVSITAPEGFSCRTAAWGSGVLVGVQYDDAPAFVAFRDPMGTSQVVEVLQCGTGDVLRSTTLPTRD